MGGGRSVCRQDLGLVNTISLDFGSIEFKIIGVGTLFDMLDLGCADIIIRASTPLTPWSKVPPPPSPSLPPPLPSLPLPLEIGPLIAARRQGWARGSFVEAEAEAEAD